MATRHKEIMILEDDGFFLEDMLEALEGLGSISTYRYKHELIKACKTTRPDVLILDVMIDDAPAGIEAARELNQYYAQDKIPLIFLTGSHKKLLVMDEVIALMPHTILGKDGDSLVNLVNNVKSILTKPHNERLPKEMQQAIEQTVEAVMKQQQASPTHKPDTLYLEKNIGSRQLVKVDASEVLYVQGASSQIEIYVKGWENRVILTCKLGDFLQERLAKGSTYYLQVHKSFVINTQHIIGRDKHYTNVTLDGGEIIKVSATYREELKQALS